MKLYLDVCCLNRPFDDQTQDRVRLEAEAILLILNRLGSRRWHLIGSEVIQFEIEQIPNRERAERVRQLAGVASSVVRVGASEVLRAEELQEMGFREFDALHLACAESAGADFFLSTDDKLLRTASRVSGKLRLQVANPLAWISEVIRK